MVLDIQKPSDPAGLTLEGWAQGFMIGSLVMMACITVANMRGRVLLHKLILIELIFGMFQGTFIFLEPPYYGWYLSVGAIFLNASWSMHNLIAWLKNKPFLSKRVSMIYIGSVILVQPYWVVEIVANFLYFNNINDLFKYTRPYEALFRDPWWIYTCCSLFWNIKKRYEFGIFELCRVCPRFGILLAAMCLSVIFLLVDILAVTHVIGGSLPDGLNPFWKLSFVFKCLTDAVILDDFKTALDRLQAYKMSRFTVGGEHRRPSTSDRRFSDTLPMKANYHAQAWGRDAAVKAKDYAELQEIEIEQVDIELQRPQAIQVKTTIRSNVE